MALPSDTKSNCCAVCCCVVRGNLSEIGSNRDCWPAADVRFMIIVDELTQFVDRGKMRLNMMAIRKEGKAII